MNQRRLARCDVFQSNNRGRQVSIVPGVTGLPGPCCRKLCGKFCRKLREIICLWQAGKMQAHGRQELDVSSFLNEKSIQMTPVPRAMQDICPKYKVNCVGHNLDKILSLLGETYSKGNMSAQPFWRQWFQNICFYTAPVCSSAPTQIGASVVTVLSGIWCSSAVN